nr:glycosyltransferase family 1 protein [uncultured Flavobacterium sp.]
MKKTKTNNMNKPTNIFVDCHVFDKEFQGTQTYIRGLYLELLQHEHLHFFLAAYDITNLETIFGTHKNVTYVKYKSKNAVIRLLLLLPYLIKRHKIEYAHFQYRVPPIKFCKYILTIHDVLFEDFPSYFSKQFRIFSFITFKFSAKISDYLFTISSYSKNRIETHLNVKGFVVHPNGVQAVFFEPYDKEKVKKEAHLIYQIKDYIIFVSRWEPRKNHLLLLKAFVEQELYKQCDLVFVGDKKNIDEAYLKYYTSLSLDIKQKIKSFENVPFKQLLLLIRGAKLSVYPSSAEGFGIPPLETIATKTPTICANETAMSDFTFLAENLVSLKDVKAFQQEISNAINHPEEEDSLVKKAAFVKENYNWQIAAQIFINSLKLTQA